MSAYSTAVLADSPAAYWLLNETSGTAAADSSGNGHTGVYNPTYTLGVSGEPTGDLAVTLDGSTGSVQSGSAVGVAADHAQTFEAWCKRASTGAYVGIISFGTGAGYLRWTATNQLELVANGVVVAATSSVTHTDTNWHHVAVTYAGSGGLVSFYFDGAVEGTPANTAHTLAASGIYSAVGMCSGYNVQYFNGTIGEAAIYPTALSAARILAHYQAGAGAVAYFVTLTATSISVPALRKAAGKGLAAVSLTVPALRKAIAKTLAATSTSAASMRKAITKTLSVTSSTIAALIAAKGSGAVAYFVTLTATSTSIASIQKAVGKGLGAISTTAPVVRKAVGKSLSAVSISTVSITKAITKTLSAVSLSAPALATVKNALVVIHLALGKLISRAGTGAIKTRSGIGRLISRSGLGNLRSK